MVERIHAGFKEFYAFYRYFARGLLVVDRTYEGPSRFKHVFANNGEHGLNAFDSGEILDLALNRKCNDS